MWLSYFEETREKVRPPKAPNAFSVSSFAKIHRATTYSLYQRLELSVTSNLIYFRTLNSRFVKISNEYTVNTVLQGGRRFAKKELRQYTELVQTSFICG